MKKQTLLLAIATIFAFIGKGFSQTTDTTKTTVPVTMQVDSTGGATNGPNKTDSIVNVTGGNPLFKNNVNNNNTGTPEAMRVMQAPAKTDSTSKKKRK